jgi:predicted enzyme related to lactoylglutathione lyase
MRLRCAMIFAKDMKVMMAFYRDAVGLIPLPAESSDGWVEFDAGGAAFALHAIPAHIANDIEITTPPTAREETPIKLVFEVLDIEVARRQLIDHGAMMFEPWSSSACDGVDPEGNVFQIVSVK